MKNKEYISVPTLFTSLNLFSGFASVVLAAAGKLDHAAWLIFIAAVFDALDGRLARYYGHASEFGIQIDSLADVVSSGLTVSFLVYQAYLKEMGLTGLIISYMPLLLAAFRLARYNVLTMQKGKLKDFLGLPAPAAAVSLASVVLLYEGTHLPFLRNALVFLVPIISLLMASTIRYDGFPRMSLREKGNNRIKLAILFVTPILMIFFDKYALCGFMTLYVLSGPVGFLKALFQHRKTSIGTRLKKRPRRKDDRGE